MIILMRICFWICVACVAFAAALGLMMVWGTPRTQFTDRAFYTAGIVFVSAWFILMFGKVLGVEYRPSEPDWLRFKAK
jgi:hypothetical protein